MIEPGTRIVSTTRPSRQGLVISVRWGNVRPLYSVMWDNQSWPEECYPGEIHIPNVVERIAGLANNVELGLPQNRQKDTTT